MRADVVDLAGELAAAARAVGVRLVHDDLNSGARALEKNYKNFLRQYS